MSFTDQLKSMAKNTVLHRPTNNSRGPTFELTAFLVGSSSYKPENAKYTQYKYNVKVTNVEKLVAKARAEKERIADLPIDAPEEEQHTYDFEEYHVRA